MKIRDYEAYVPKTYGPTMSIGDPNARYVQQYRMQKHEEALNLIGNTKYGKECQSIYKSRESSYKKGR